ncbi:MAG: type II toxin-antitoxin system PemK/MazF family toxin [Cyclobacteriaceae bacterium]
MKTGSILLVPFPFAEFTDRKVRPCVLICQTKDKYSDLVIAAISSVVPKQLTDNEILLQPSAENGLRKVSVIKMDRIVTMKREDLIAHIGELENSDLTAFKQKFKALVDR